ncbi:unnamed protein product [Arctia plantaginis]|uniref:Carboxypeptidase n=1 Tax=Arctia plantaginis TaxID=874455 RepID=A0A8S1AW67_ARCPL|nr:unnamed protein product [Arctia plantaginis]
MVTSQALAILILSVNCISAFLLFKSNGQESLWKMNLNVKEEKQNANTDFECSNGFCKFLNHTDGQGDALILTPLIETGKIAQARNLSIVDPSHFAGVNSHAAYFTVNKTNKWHLFFWYFPAENVPLESTPLIIWLQGGPGSSSFFGLFEEIGPLQITNGKVERKPITWGSNYSLLFIDNPVGSGFSFTENPNLYARDENTVGQSLLNFLQQFLQVFSELRQAPLFIAGESYAGKYIPAFGYYIHHNKNDSMPINLKGLAIGNGWTDPPTLMHYSEFALQVGLLDPKQAAKVHQFEEDSRNCWNKRNMSCFTYNADRAYTTLIYNAPVSQYNYLKDASNKINVTPFSDFLNKAQIQDLLHVKKMKYYPLNYVVYGNLYSDFYLTVKPWLEELLEHYGVMCYSGQLDVIVAYALAVHTYQSLKWSGQNAYLNATRFPLVDEVDNSKIISFVKASGNFMDVMVRGAGHMVPADQPRAAKQVIDMFIKKFK